MIEPAPKETRDFRADENGAHAAWDSFIPALQPEDIARAVRFIAEQPAHANIARSMSIRRGKDSNLAPTVPTPLPLYCVEVSPCRDLVRRAPP